MNSKLSKLCLAAALGIFTIILSLDPGARIEKLTGTSYNYYVDLLQHSSWYFGLTILSSWIFNQVPAWRIALLLFGLSVILEIAQYFIPDRSFSPHDLVMNFTGVAAAFVAVSLTRHFRRQQSRRIPV